MPDNGSRNPEREARILDAAMALISHYGVDKTTMDDIAREAGVSKGALYLHFKSKDELFETLILRESERVADRIFDQVMEDPDGGSIFKMFSYSLMAMAENPLMRALYSQDRRVLGDYLRKLRSGGTYQQGFDFGVAFVQQMQAAGLVRSDVSADVITYVMGIVRYGLLTIDEAVSINQPPPLDTVAPIISDMLTRVFAPEGGSSLAGKQAFAQLIEYSRAVIQERRAAREAKI